MHRSHRCLTQPVLLALVFFHGVTITPSSAQPPAVQRVQPLAVVPGTTTEIQIVGQQLTTSTRLWTSCPLTAQLTPEKPPGHFTVSAAADTALGVHGLRVVTDAGVSPLALFLVDDMPAVLAAADNRTRETAQVVTPPVAVDGVVEKLQRHFYRFEVTAGQRLSFEAFARRLGSPLDPALFLYDEAGRELAYADDVEGLSGDCQLLHTFDKAGPYTVELRDIRYEGGAGHFYRLRIGDFPCVSVPYPLAVQRGQTTRVDFAGLSVADADPIELTVPADWPHPWYPVATRRSGGTSHGFSLVEVTDAVEFREHEPNNTPAQSNRITLGDRLNGQFAEPGDVDRFTFTATKGQRFVFRGVTRERGAATDLLIRLVDASEKQLARKDDDGTSEGAIDQTFPADGAYTLIVEDLHRRGGEPYAYRVDVQPFSNGFSLAAAADNLNVPAAGVGSLAITVQRRGFTGAIRVAATGLPDGWSSLPTVIGPGMTTGVLTMHGPGIGPTPPEAVDLRITGTADVDGVEITETADLTATLVNQLNKPRSVPLNVLHLVAAGVTPAKPLSIRFEPAEVILGPHLKTTVKVIADRTPAADEAITLATLPEKNALPADVTVAVKPIDKGQSEVLLEVTGGEKAPVGPFSLVLTATHTKDKVTDVVTSPGLTIRLAAAMQLQLDAGDRNLPRGGEQPLTVTVNRNPAFAGDVTLSLEKLPAGVTAEPVTLPAGQNKLDLVLKASAEAAVGEHAEIVVKATAVENDKLVATSAVGKLTIQ